jgi:FKBP-type peptidyl-prolyl cis-trans isomerase FkpA
MKQTIFTLLLIASIGLISCRKTRNDPNIAQYDQTQIQSYINANGLTGMKKDTSHGDTSGIYYQILSQGSTTGAPLDYPDSVAFVFTLKSFDGKYVNTDTINLNHVDNLLGHLTFANLPIAKGLQAAIHDLVKYRGTRARILIPSRVAFGVNGYGTGSSSNTNTRILGNQCLDYYVNVVSSVDKYDDDLINAYIKRNNLTGYTAIGPGNRGRGVYYKVTTPGSGAGDVLTDASSFTVNAYSGKYIDDVVFDAGPASGSPITFSSGGYIAGVLEALRGQTAGAVVSMFIPSRLAYGKAGGVDQNTGAQTLGPNVVLHFTDFTIGTVTNP